MQTFHSNRIESSPLSHCVYKYFSGLDAKKWLFFGNLVTAINFDLNFCCLERFSNSTRLTG